MHQAPYPLFLKTFFCLAETCIYNPDSKNVGTVCERKRMKTIIWMPVIFSPLPKVLQLVSSVSRCSQTVKRRGDATLWETWPCPDFYETFCCQSGFIYILNNVPTLLESGLKKMWMTGRRGVVTAVCLRRPHYHIIDVTSHYYHREMLRSGVMYRIVSALFNWW